MGSPALLRVKYDSENSPGEHEVCTDAPKITSGDDENILGGEVPLWISKLSETYLVDTMKSSAKENKFKLDTEILILPTSYTAISPFTGGNSSCRWINFLRRMWRGGNGDGGRRVRRGRPSLYARHSQNCPEEFLSIHRYKYLYNLGLSTR